MNGARGPYIKPLVVAAYQQDASVVQLLLKKGADIEVACTEEMSFFGKGLKMKGTCALHVAAGVGGMSIASVLLQAGANPNAKNADGRTPLMYSCELWDKEQRVGMAQLLVEAGGDVLLAENTGEIPLHFAARRGYLPMIDFFLAKAPSTLNQAALHGETAFGIAGHYGHEEAVSLLLSAGARSRIFVDNHICALHGATQYGHEGVVRILVDRGIEAMGGVQSIPGALQIAVERGFPRILRILLDAEGESRWRHWAMFRCSSFSPLLHVAAGHVVLSCASVLLAVEADETVVDGDGKRSVDVIGSLLPQGSSTRDPEKEAALRRMLARGSAFRARSWAWRVGSAPTAAVAATSVFASAAAGKKATAPLGVRIFRPKSGNFFVRIIGR